MRSGKKSQSVLVLAAAGLGALFLGFPLALRAFVLEAFKIPSASMEPALLIGDHIFVDKLPFHRATVTRGEVILFPFPENPEQDFVKRVIALPGDTLLVKNGHPWINGWEVPHCVVGTGQLPPSEGLTPSGEVDVEYLDGTAYLVFFDVASLGGLSETNGPYTARAGETWVLGDNRNASHDSRFWFGGRGGGVPLDSVIGRALFRWLSVADGVMDGSRFATSVATPLLPKSMKSLETDLKRCLAQAPPIEGTRPPIPR